MNEVIQISLSKQQWGDLLILAACAKLDQEVLDYLRLRHDRAPSRRKGQ